jgi:hypothetical protein
MQKGHLKVVEVGSNVAISPKVRIYETEVVNENNNNKQ